VTLNYVNVNSVQMLVDCQRRHCGKNGRDFWLGCISGTSHEALTETLPTMQVGPFWAAVAFSHCYAALSSTPEEDVAALTKKLGLGLRLRNPARQVIGPGLVYLLVKEDGFSMLYKYNVLKKLIPKDPQPSASAGELRGSSSHSRKRSIPCRNEEEIPASAKQSKQKKSSHRLEAVSVVSDPLTSSTMSRQAASDKSANTSNREPGHQPHSELHLRQVAVIKKRLDKILPDLPFESLSTSLALTKLEECMQKRKGRFDGFRADIERIIIAYVAKHAETAKAAAEAEKTPSQPTMKGTSLPKDKVTEPAENAPKAPAPAPQAVPEPDKDSSQGSSATQRSNDSMGTRSWSRQVLQVLPVAVDEGVEEMSVQEPVTEMARSQPPAMTEVAQEMELPEDEVSDDCVEEGVEVDEHGFQMALARLRESVQGDPSNAVAVLKMLAAAVPSQQLLLQGPWEAALSAHRRMAPNPRIARWAQTVCERWRLLWRPLQDDAKSYRQAFAALEQLMGSGEAAEPLTESTGDLLHVRSTVVID